MKLPEPASEGDPMEQFLRESRGAGGPNTKGVPANVVAGATSGNQGALALRDSVNNA